jgi:hypothetical protein
MMEHICNRPNGNIVFRTQNGQWQMLDPKNKELTAITNCPFCNLNLYEASPP